VRPGKAPRLEGRFAPLRLTASPGRPAPNVCGRRASLHDESTWMHPELRRARGLYHEWRGLGERDRGRIGPFAREVKELALDLRGQADGEAAARELALANDALEVILRNTPARRAA
jgi:hypothetical protein